ncbi:MAG: pyridoxamine 5'-phosphate oxidase [Chloroflexi bacterium]|nr:MAG: pyridoxamine 5'-phosphate oxidase [Chloroflexota bacterium]
MTNTRPEISIADMRREYTLAGLREEDAAADPFDQFAIWFKEATDAQVIESNAMALATATPDGRPSVRIVLLKGVDTGGFVFFTNYESRKGCELAANPHAALLFYWAELTRQIRIEGTIAKVSEQESADYFATRSPLSRLGAWASRQSSVIAGRHVLDERLAALQQQFPDDQIPLPPFWGGYRLTPHTFEFWHGRPNRLHDRLRYRTDGIGGWVIERLSP